MFQNKIANLDKIEYSSVIPHRKKFRPAKYLGISIEYNPIFILKEFQTSESNYTYGNSFEELVLLGNDLNTIYENALNLVYFTDTIFDMLYKQRLCTYEFYKSLFSLYKKFRYEFIKINKQLVTTAINRFRDNLNRIYNIYIEEPVLLPQEKISV